MKYTTERDTIVFNMWNLQNMSFKTISEQQLPSELSLKRIRNIIYGGPSRLKSNHEKEIYRNFRLKFLELKNINDAITFTYLNQPDTTICIRSIRNIINRELKKKHLIKNNIVNQF